MFRTLCSRLSRTTRPYWSPCRLGSFALLVLAGLPLLSGRHAPLAPVSTEETSAPAPLPTTTALGQLPLSFVQNTGQLDARVAFALHGKETSVYFTSEGLTFRLASPEAQPATPAAVTPVSLRETAPPAPSPRWVLKLDFLGANPAVRPVGHDPTPATMNYFSGTPDQWHTAVPTYRKLVYPNLWPGIDLEYSGTGQQLKYTFIVQPGADPNLIQLAYRGADSVSVTDAGQLAVTTPVSSFTDATPYVYQEAQGTQVAVASAYILHADTTPGQHRYGFQVGAYDQSQPLYLDPAILVYAGYLGGSEDDSGYGIAVDTTGHAYIGGYTFSTSATFPELVGPDLSDNGNADAFIAKIKADGSGLVYAGFIGGGGSDYATGVAVDGLGNAYVIGGTNSTQDSSSGIRFPVRIGPDLTYNGGNEDVFVAKVKADGTDLVYCGYLGGTSRDAGRAIALDIANNAYITGYTYSTNLFTLIGPDLSPNLGTIDAFVAKVAADGSRFLYSGYIGGLGEDGGFGIAVSLGGTAYVTGYTSSTEASFPDGDGFGLLPSFDATHNGGVIDAFVVKVRIDGTALDYAGYIGGSGPDSGNGITRVGGQVMVVGNTRSTQATFPDGDGFGPLRGPDTTHNGDYDGFVAQVAASGLSLTYASYIGGVGSDAARAVARDGLGNVYVTGLTDSPATSFPDGDGFGSLPGPDRSHNGGSDAFVVKVRHDGSEFLYAGYIGGAFDDDGFGIAVDRVGNAYVVGTTESLATTFPDGDGFGTLPGPDRSHNGESDAFVAKIAATPLATLAFFRPASATWFVDADRSGTISGCTLDVCLPAFGVSTDIPFFADWYNQGLPAAGVFRPALGRWFLDTNANGKWDPTAGDVQYGPFGLATDKPVVGKWEPTLPFTRIGVFRPSTGMWYLDRDGDGKWDGPVDDRQFGPFGTATDLPVVGRWTGTSDTRIGFYRPSTRRWHLDANNDGLVSPCGVDTCLGPFGAPTDIPVIGDWADAGKDHIGVYRPSTGYWYLDRNGNGVWEGCTTDLCAGPVGLPTDKPLTVAW